MELSHEWTKGEILQEKHFTGTFIFPDDLNFIGETTNCQFFCDVFNDMIKGRIKSRQDKESPLKSKLDGKTGKIR